MPLLGHWTHLSIAQKGNSGKWTHSSRPEATIILTALWKLQELSAASFTKSRLRLHAQQPFRHTHATNTPKWRCAYVAGMYQWGAAHTWYPGMDLTASTTARDIRCWTNGILCPSGDLSGMQTSRVERAHPKGLSQAFFPRPGTQATSGNRPACPVSGLRYT